MNDHRPLPAAVEPKPAPACGCADCTCAPCRCSTVHRCGCGSKR